MNEQITIKIGANATQAMAEMGRVRKAAMGMREGLLGIRAGLGLASGFIGFNLLSKITEPMREAFSDATKAATAFNFALESASKGLYLFTLRLAETVTGTVFETVFDAIIRNFIPGGMPPVALLAQANAYVAQNAAQMTTPGSPDFIGPMPPASGQLADRLVKNTEEQTEYQRRMTEALDQINRDMEKTRFLDPW